MKKLRVALALACIFVGNANAQSIQKYFGYYYADYSDQTTDTTLNQTKAHINLYSILNVNGQSSDAGRAQTSQYILGELAKAKAAHVHAIVPAHPFVFLPGSSGGHSCWQNYASASQSWANFASQMVAQGFLIPGDPDRSVVTAVYLVDEPDGTCLGDVGSSANPALTNAVNAVKLNANTGNLPVATIVSSGFFSGGFDSGAKLFNWIGFDSYSDNDATWNSHMGTLKAKAPNKGYIIVPGAQAGAITSTCVGTNNTSRFFNSIQTDPQVVWLTPFVWWSAPACAGVRDNTALKAAYTQEGRTIKAQGCASSSKAKSFCKSPSIQAVLDVVLND